jgi:hypothetical protein
MNMYYRSMFHHYASWAHTIMNTKHKIYLYKSVPNYQDILGWYYSFVDCLMLYGSSHKSFFQLFSFSNFFCSGDGSMLPMKFMILFLHPVSSLFEVAVLCCAVLCCAVLCCAVLCYMLCHVVLEKSVQLSPLICQFSLGSVILSIRVRESKNRLSTSQPVN